MYQTLRNLRKQIIEFSKFAGYKVNLQKSVVFPNTINKTQAEMKLPFVITSKYEIGINLTKHV